jgi:hypothetical protein
MEPQVACSGLMLGSQRIINNVLTIITILETCMHIGGWYVAG